MARSPDGRHARQPGGDPVPSARRSGPSPGRRSMRSATSRGVPASAERRRRPCHRAVMVGPALVLPELPLALERLNLNDDPDDRVQHGRQPVRVHLVGGPRLLRQSALEMGRQPVDMGAQVVRRHQAGAACHVDGHVVPGRHLVRGRVPVRRDVGVGARAGEENLGMARDDRDGSDWRGRRGVRSSPPAEEGTGTAHATATGLSPSKTTKRAEPALLEQGFGEQRRSALKAGWTYMARAPGFDEAGAQAAWLTAPAARFGEASDRSSLSARLRSGLGARHGVGREGAGDRPSTRRLKPRCRRMSRRLRRRADA